MVPFSLRQLEYLRAVARTGGFAQAARQVSMSPAAVAGAIDALEAALDLKLFDRFPASGLRLTGPGAAFLETALDLLARADEAHRMARRLASGAEGRLRFGCYMAFAPIFAPPLLARFGADWPGIAVEVTEDWFAGLAERLEAGSLDLALAYDQGFSPAALDLRPVARVRPRVVLAQGHPLAARRDLSLVDLAGLPCVAVTESGPGPGFLDALRAEGVDPPIALRCRSYELARSCVGQGMGFALSVFQPPHARTYQGDTVVARPLRDLRAEWSIVVAARRGALDDPGLSGFADLCAQLVRGALEG